MRSIIPLLFSLSLSANLFAQDSSNDSVKQKLDQYAIAIATEANPQKALEFLRDTPFQQDAMDIDENLTIKLVAYSQAIVDLDEYVSRNFKSEDHNSINSELTIRMDYDKPLCQVGICPQPENMVKWLKKYKGFSSDKIAIFEKAIRKWEVLFGTATQKTVNWGQAGTQIVTKDSWDSLTLKKRNEIIAKIPFSGRREDRQYLEYNPSLTDSINERDMVFNTALQLINSSGVLTQSQLNSLSGKPFDEQLSLLGQYFDGSQVAAHPELKPLVDKIHSYRHSSSAEIMSSEQRRMLSEMLKISLMSEVKGTKAGNRINKFYNGSHPPISVEYCDDCYSKYEGGKIVIDAGLIEQYMRVKGYKASDLFKDKVAVDDITKFVSPAFITAASYQMTDKYFSSRGIYNPPVQERGALAYSMQGLYTTEKFSKDVKFKGIFEQMSSTNYGSRVITVQSSFSSQGSKHFTDNISQLYFSDLPSAESARSQILLAVNEEIARRQALDEKGKAEAERLATLPADEAYSMTSEEFIGSVSEMGIELLTKVRSDMISVSNPDAYYRNSMRNLRSDASSLKSKPVAENKVPVPGA